MSERLSSYTELAEVLDVLPILLREARRARGLRMQDVAEQMGIAASTVCRIEAGEGYRVDSATAVLRWLDSRPHVTVTPVTTEERHDRDA